MLSCNGNLVNPCLSTTWMWANKILLTCVSKMVALQLKYPQISAKRTGNDSSILYKKKYPDS